jgi:hypothetical protein
LPLVVGVPPVFSLSPVLGGEGRVRGPYERHAVPAFARLVKQRASPLSRKWGRWLEDFDPKDDALRTAEWFRDHHPDLVARAMTGGDAAASILAELSASGGRVPSEATLATRCGVTRAAIRDALANLQSIGHVRTERHGRAHAVEVIRPSKTA